jgi:nucleotide-binding universal stress UspA family protein
MGYKSLLVHLDLGRSNENMLQFASELAKRFDARVMGITACAPPIMAYADVGVDGETYELERDQIEDQIGSAEVEFRAAFRDRNANVEWRAAEDDADLVRYVCRQARNADLLVTAVAQGDMFDNTRAMHTGALVMQVGRPVLLVPLAAKTAKLDRVLVGWKDTRETRRAIADALPLMRHAEVTVVEVAAGENMEATRRHLDDVVAWLMQHGVAAKSYPVASTGSDAVDLQAAADRERCDIIVAGAYGHSRVREWMLGGVTKDLLMSPHRCSLVSH